MIANQINYNQTGYFSSFICDYIDEKEVLQPFYNRFPKLENFKDQIQEKHSSFSKETRNVIVKVLQNQYKSSNTASLVNENIQLLQKENTFTVTTGHQLNLFTGPLYFVYKIIATINLCEQLSSTYPNCNFVPIYWMATEDHDFEEINFFNFKNDKIEWNRSFGGAVGELSTNGLKEVFNEVEQKFGLGKNADDLKKLFKDSYLTHDSLADATRHLVNELFGHYGLVIVDANCKVLKELFIPYAKKELIEQPTANSVNETNKNLEKVQVNPRDINLFYLQEGSRERIIKEGNIYKVNNTNIVFEEKELLKHLNIEPERFSPNVLLRPLYQEVILPNLCYIGGGGELAYWLQLKYTFKAFEVPLPMLLLRNSAVIISENQSAKMEKLNLTIDDLFLKQESLVKAKIESTSELTIDFSEQKEHLQKQFVELFELAKQTDQSFVGAVAAQERKQIKGLENLEKRLLRAEKRKYSAYLAKIKEVQDTVFPKQSLQERYANFSEFYLEYGKGLIPMLKENLDPLQLSFTVVLDKTM